MSSDPFHFVLLKWHTNGGKDRQGMVCGKCYDAELAVRRTRRKEFIY